MESFLGSFLAYFPKVGLCELLCLRVSPAHVAARQRGLLFDERMDRPFSAGALTEQSSGPPTCHTETDYYQSQIQSCVTTDDQSASLS
jgi:hypothetical protein